MSTFIEPWALCTVCRKPVYFASGYWRSDDEGPDCSPRPGTITAGHSPAPESFALAERRSYPHGMGF